MDPAIDFTKCPFVYWSNVVKLSYLQRRIIVYSIMYYECDESCVSDNYYDRMSQQLVGLMKQCTQSELEASTYYYAMYDFDGSTGFDVPGRLTPKDKAHLTALAMYIHKLWEQEGKPITL